MRLFSLLRLPEIVLRLLIQPALRCGVERHGKPQRHLGADASPAVENGRQGLTTDAKPLGSFGNAGDQAARYKARE